MQLRDMVGVYKIVVQRRLIKYCHNTIRGYLKLKGNAFKIGERKSIFT